MRRPARIRSWQTDEQMLNWLRCSPDKQAYQRRQAVWLTHRGRLHASRIAEMLGVSVQAVWLWIGQYNRLGPAGLERTGRGGKRYSILDENQKLQLALHLQREDHDLGRIPISVLAAHVIRLTARRISRSTLYRLRRELKNYPPLVTDRQDRPSSSAYNRLLHPWRI